MSISSSPITTLEGFWKLKSICAFKGLNVKHLYWQSCKFTQVEVITLLNFFPNLITLKCDGWRLQSEYFDEPNEMLNLPQLNNLSVSKCDEITKSIFETHLSKDTLVKLRTDFISLPILTNHSSIKELSVNWYSSDLDSNPLINHKLTLFKLEMCENGGNIFTSIIQNQSSLVHLDILECTGIFMGNDNAFASICDLKHLKILKIKVENLSERAFKEHFYKLDSLQELEIQNSDLDQISSLIDIIECLSNTKMLKLTTLKFDFDFLNVPIARIENMGKNFPSLKHLKLNTDRCQCHPIDIYLRSFKNLESLFINYNYKRNFPTICDDVEEKFTNLIDLNLEGFSFGSDELNLNEFRFIKVTEKMPNLVSLDLDINLPFNLKILTRLLTKMPKLRIVKNLLMQHGNIYEKFGFESVENLIEISRKLKEFKIEFKLKAIDMNVAMMKEILGKEFTINMGTLGVFVNLRLNKKT